MDEEKFLGSGGGRAGKPPPYQAAVEDGGRRCRHVRVIGRKFRQTAAASAPLRKNSSFFSHARKIIRPGPAASAGFLSTIQDRDLAHPKGFEPLASAFGGQRPKFFCAYYECR